MTRRVKPYPETPPADLPVDELAEQDEQYDDQLTREARITETVLFLLLIAAVVLIVVLSTEIYK